MARLVLDTNVLISAVLSHGPARALLTRCINRTDLLLTSDAALAELEEVLRRPKFRLDPQHVDRTMHAVQAIAERIEPGVRLEIIRADPDDDRFLELALEGRADLIVSGDGHLLALRDFRGTPIHRVRQALAYLRCRSDPGERP